MYRLLPLVLSIYVCLSQPAAAQPGSYTFTKLNATFPNTDQTLAHGINDLGDVVGNYHNSSGDHGFVLKRGVYASFDVPGARDTVGFGVNIFGAIVGAWDNNGTTHGFLLSNGKFTTLDFPGSTFTLASAINALGEAVGWYQDSAGHTHGFLYQFGRFSAINVPFAGVTGTSPAGINTLGQIVGSYTLANGTIHAFVDSWGAFRNIDAPGSSTESVANAIDDFGEIVLGASLLERGIYYPFQAGFPNVNFTNGLGINNFGQIVGIYRTSLTDGQEFSFLATPSR